MTAARVSPDALQPFGEIYAFLTHEAQLLDSRQYEKWLSLFAEDGIYWIPSRRNQADPKFVPSIVYEDKHLLGMRVHRLLHPNAHAALPAPRTIHAISNLAITDSDGEKAHVRVASALLVAEYQDGRNRTYAAQCEHVLKGVDGTFRIASKRVELIDCDGAHEDIVVIL